MQDLMDRHWHHLPDAEAVDLLDADAERGLDRLEAEERQRRFGPNALTPRKGRGPLLRFLDQFNQALVYVLLAAILVKLALGGYVDAGVIFGVVLLNAVIGFVQESKAASALDALSRSLTTEATVMRGGERRRVDARELVPGDMVLLASGDKVPADLRLLRVRSLKVDESALTGESVPVEKRAGVMDRDTPLADRANMAYSSTFVTFGTAAGLVAATGDNTEVGRISELIARVDPLETPLTRQIARFSRLLLFGILALAALTFVIGLLHGESWIDMFMAAVALAVAMIPEGLPAVLTITLAIGVARMARRHAVIRRLPAVETLGSTSVICSDKTGTLTRNEMTVQRLWAGADEYALSGVGYAPEGGLTADGARVEPAGRPALTELLRAGLLCNDAVLREDGDAWRIEGDPTEGALLTAAAKVGLAAAEEHGSAPRLDAVPFESEHQYMATLHGGARPMVYLKGSVESLLSRCDGAIDRDGTVIPLDPEAVRARVEALAARGLRVLAFARMDGAGRSGIDHPDLTDRLTFLGLQGMIDPPREEAVRAVAACRRAGVSVKMITGDHALTAAAIAGQIGLGERADDGTLPAALSGRELAELHDDDLIRAAEQTAVFARVTPEQKLRLVEAIQARGAVVAMTGDGVNDAPALRQADIGVSMGLTGTEVAKEAADMVLTDDNFATIEAAVEEGRGVFDNLTKFITWILPTNAGQGLVILVAVLLAQPLPVLPVQALWINMTTAVLLGLTLAFEPKEPALMDRAPRPPGASILDAVLLQRILLVALMLLAGAFGLFEWALYHGASVEQARTVAVNVFAVGQAFYLLNCRSLRWSMFRIGVFSNPWIWAGIAAMALVQLAFTYLPIMNRLFHTAPISAGYWLALLAVGLVIYGVMGLEKLLRPRGTREPLVARQGG
ncbi:cation-transporting P-type ATPase [Thiorhodococcus minor]|uniref:Cation-transporting P-type ATPase n=1 Tax=Thiorhodococcus minor TaxID=57489 RepID=A0A6M0K4E6_9GAMM|nr:cation-transporting P-type ATPase [Thiorhodococcus minor]NEV63235.1 cation-transporting P-type ATPase [Thiorhodococcus minor]